MKPVIIGMHNAKSSDPADAMEPYTVNGAGERLWTMVNAVCGCSREKYSAQFELMNILEAKEWSAKDANLSAGLVRFKLSGRICFVLGRETWEALKLPKLAKWFSTERSYTGTKYILLPHPSGRNVMYNDAKMRNKAGTMLAKAGGFIDVPAQL